MTDKKETSKPDIEGFMTDEEILKEKGFGGGFETHTKIHYKSRISLNMDQVNDLNASVPYALKELLPGYEICPERGWVNLTDKNLGFATLEEGIFYFVKKNGQDTGDVVKIGSTFVIYEGNGNQHISHPISDFLPKHLKQVLRGERFSRYNLNRLGPLVNESLESLRRLLEPERTNRTIEQIVEDVKINEPEKLECKAQSYNFLSDMQGIIEDIANEGGTLGGLTATDEYKAPDSKNAGEIYIKKEDPKFTGLLNTYPDLKELTAIAQGLLIINYFAELKLNKAMSLAAKIPAKYQKIVYSVYDKLNTKENLKGG